MYIVVASPEKKSTKKIDRNIEPKTSLLDEHVPLYMVLMPPKRIDAQVTVILRMRTALTKTTQSRAPNFHPFYPPESISMDPEDGKDNLDGGGKTFSYSGRRSPVSTTIQRPPCRESLEYTMPDQNAVGSCHQDEVSQMPVTPVLVEGFASLHNLIKQDAHTLNKASI